MRSVPNGALLQSASGTFVRFLAFWVSLGIPISFFRAIALMP